MRHLPLALPASLILLALGAGCRDAGETEITESESPSAVAPAVEPEAGRTSAPGVRPRAPRDPGLAEQFGMPLLESLTPVREGEGFTEYASSQTYPEIRAWFSRNAEELRVREFERGARFESTDGSGRAVSVRWQGTGSRLIVTYYQQHPVLMASGEHMNVAGGGSIGGGGGGAAPGSSPSAGGGSAGGGSSNEGSLRPESGLANGGGSSPGQVGGGVGGDPSRGGAGEPGSPSIGGSAPGRGNNPSEGGPSGQRQNGGLGEPGGPGTARAPGGPWNIDPELGAELVPETAPDGRQLSLQQRMMRTPEFDSRGNRLFGHSTPPIDGRSGHVPISTRVAPSNPDAQF